MGGLIVFGIIVAAFVVLDLLALRYGVDSRWGFEEDPRAPVQGISI